MSSFLLCNSSPAAAAAAGIREEKRRKKCYTLVLKVYAIESKANQ